VFFKGFLVGCPSFRTEHLFGHLLNVTICYKIFACPLYNSIFSYNALYYEIAATKLKLTRAKMFGFHHKEPLKISKTTLYIASFINNITIRMLIFVFIELKIIIT